MTIKTAIYTCSGGHEINEDSFLCGDGVYAVADGLGGHENGETASSAVVDYLRDSFRGDISDGVVSELLEGANSAVLELNNGSCSTVAAVLCTDKQIRLANVGDSRAYYFRDGELLAMTKDHSVCQVAIDLGDMTFDEIRDSADRSKLMKVLGGEKSLNLKKLYEPIIPQDGDAFLICSDGFWEYVYEREMEADLLKSSDPEKWLNDMLKRQLLRAKNEGDNYTAICGYIHLSDDELAQEASRQCAATVEKPHAKRCTRLVVLVITLALLLGLAVFLAVLELRSESGSDELSSAASEFNENNDALSVSYGTEECSVDALGDTTASARKEMI